MISKNIYLNCGIYRDSSEPLLFVAVPGYFASTAWCRSDEEYNAVMGRKFEGITSDDNKSYMLDRNNIRRITDEDNIDEILERSNPDFVTYFKETFCYGDEYYSGEEDKKQFKSDLEAYGLLNNVTDEQFNEMYPEDTVTVYGKGY